MKYIIAAAAVSVALSTSSHAQLTTDYDDGAAAFWASLAESTNNADDFVMFSWLADSAELKATDEAIQNALDVSDEVDADDIPVVTKSAPDAKFSANNSDVGFATTVNEELEYTGTYEEYDLELNEAPDHDFTADAWIFQQNDYQDFQVHGKIILDKDRTRTHDVTDYVNNYNNEIYIVEVTNESGYNSIQLVYEYSAPIWSETSGAHNISDYCNWATCVDGKEYYIHTDAYSIVDGKAQYYYGAEYHTANDYNGMTKEELIEHIKANPAEHALHWRDWDKANTFIVERNGKKIADYETYSLWHDHDLKKAYEMIEEVANEAYEAGFEDGYSEGYSDGYSDGFADGVNSVKDQLQ